MEVKTPDTSTALKRQKAKKAKKDTPARIISLPVPGEKPEPEATRPAQASPATPAAPARRAPRVIEVAKTKEEKPAPAPEKDDKKAKVKKKRAKKPGTAEDD